jgi:hypothetical protein
MHKGLRAPFAAPATTFYLFVNLWSGLVLFAVARAVAVWMAK